MTSGNTGAAPPSPGAAAPDDAAPTGEGPPGDPREYTIDDLAALTRVPSRTIRFYQSKNVLPRPHLRGRVAYYGEAHVERLKLVAELQDRGLQIKAIGDIVARLEKGDLALNDWLGLEDQLKEPWANDRPRLVDAAELRALAGDDRPGRIAELVRAGLVERKGESFLVPSPSLLQAAIRLEAAGLELPDSVEAGGLMRRHLGKAARELVEFFVKHATSSDRAEGPAASLTEMVRMMRPTAMDALRVIFAQEIEREIRKLVETGQTAKLTRKPRR
jgi:DNA-binding transcriptional MerR regulator